MPLYHQNPLSLSLSLVFPRSFFFLACLRERASAFFYTPKLLLSTSTDGKKQFLLLSVTRLCFRRCPCLPYIFLLSQHRREEKKKKKKKKKKKRKYFCVCALDTTNDSQFNHTRLFSSSSSSSLSLSFLLVDGVITEKHMLKDR